MGVGARVCLPGWWVGNQDKGQKQEGLGGDSPWADSHSAPAHAGVQIASQPSPCRAHSHTRAHTHTRHTHAHTLTCLPTFTHSCSLTPSSTHVLTHIQSLAHLYSHSVTHMLT